jgi:hypothetical protein
MFRAVFSPIIRSAWLYLRYLAVFTQDAAGWYLGWVETELCGLWGAYILPDTVNTVKCSWWWAQTSPETCRLTWNNKLLFILHLVGYLHNCITMHGFMNVKYVTYYGWLREKFKYSHNISYVLLYTWFKLNNMASHTSDEIFVVYHTNAFP